MFLIFLFASTTVKFDSKQMCLLDYDTNDIILEHNADQEMYPSSMTKIMTALMFFQAIEEGTISEETIIHTPPEVYQTEGSTMFLKKHQPVRAMDLLQGIVCLSGNDAARAFAISVFGSEDACVTEMNKLAKTIGTQITNFTNASGLPNPKQITNCHDLLLITRYLLKKYPQYFKYFKQTHFTFNNITQANKLNLFLERNKIFDGVKTGFTDSGQYGMVASLFDPLTKRRLLLVVNGLPSKKSRADEGERLLLWGLRNTKNIILFNSNDSIYQIKVRFGEKNKVDLVSDMPVGITMKRHELAKKQIPQFEIHLDQKHLKAPFHRGKNVGKLVLKHNGKEKFYPLYTKEKVEKASLLKQAYHYLLSLFSV